MYIVGEGNNVVQIRILGRGRDGRHNRVKVCSILSPEDETRSFWGQINYEVHVSNIFKDREAAEKAAFIRKLS